MGIGNQEEYLLYHREYGNSLPLMGIGNFAVVEQRPRRRILITPHGDWEPDVTVRAPATQTVLITPHGGWEPGRWRPA